VRDLVVSLYTSSVAVGTPEMKNDGVDINNSGEFPDITQSILAAQEIDPIITRNHKLSPPAEPGQIAKYIDKLLDYSAMSIWLDEEWIVQFTL